jgi:CubicO group peptidase (beta-lactamase class C family)
MSTNCKINEYLNAYTNLCPFSGAVVVINNGEVIFNKSYGMASIEHSAANTSKTKYKIASHTKQITYMGIKILKERGLLDASDSLKTFFLDYPELDERITIHHLMTHASGI